jgi:hypothetical protein
MRAPRDPLARLRGLGVHAKAAALSAALRAAGPVERTALWNDLLETLAPSVASATGAASAAGASAAGIGGTAHPRRGLLARLARPLFRSRSASTADDASPLLDLVRAFPFRPSDAPFALVAEITGEGLPGLIETALADDAPARRGGVALLVAALTDPATAGATTSTPPTRWPIGRLANLLTDTDEATAQAADDALRTLARTTSAAPHAAAALARTVFSTAERALLTLGKHRRVGVAVALVEAAARAGEPDRLAPTPRGAWRTRAGTPWGHAAHGTTDAADHADHPGTTALRRLLRRSRLAAADRAAWLALKVPALRAAATERLLRPGDARGTDTAGPAPFAPRAWLAAHAHLAAHPQRAEAIAQLAPDKAAALLALGDAAATAELTPEARRGLIRLLAAAPIAPRLFDAALGAFLTDPSAEVRHAAVRAAAARAHGTGPAPVCLLDFCFDNDPSVARTAALALLSDAPPRSGSSTAPVGLVDGGARDRAFAALQRSPHTGPGSVAALARAAADTANAERRETALIIAQRAAAERDPGRVVAPLVALVQRGAPESAALATTRARRLGLVSLLSDAVSERLAAAAQEPGDTTERLAATLATALGDCDDPASAAALTRALSAPAMRLRANALDALVRRARRARSRTTTDLDALLTSLATDRAEGHRVRASAARGLFALHGAGTHTLATPRPIEAASATLLALLRDDRPLYRAAGLWGVERVAPRLASNAAADGGGVFAEAVAALVRAAGGADSAEPWATRAHRTAERLVVELRLAWSSPPPTAAAAPARQESAA